MLDELEAALLNLIVRGSLLGRLVSKSPNQEATFFEDWRIPLSTAAVPLLWYIAGSLGLPEFSCMIDQPNMLHPFDSSGRRSCRPCLYSSKEPWIPTYRQSRNVWRAKRVSPSTDTFSISSRIGSEWIWAFFYASYTCFSGDFQAQIVVALSESWTWFSMECDSSCEPLLVFSYVLEAVDALTSQSTYSSTRCWNASVRMTCIQGICECWCTEGSRYLSIRGPSRKDPALHQSDKDPSSSLSSSKP